MAAKKTPKAKSRSKKPATTEQSAVAAIGEGMMSIGAALSEKPKRRTLRAWVDEGGFGAIWKSVPKAVRKEMSRCFRVVEASKNVAPKIVEAQTKLAKLMAILDGATPAQQFLDDKVELMKSFNRTLFDGMHVEPEKRIDLAADEPAPTI